jgi:hypothetical protein
VEIEKLLGRIHENRKVQPNHNDIVPEQAQDASVVKGGRSSFFQSSYWWVAPAIPGGCILSRDHILINPARLQALISPMKGEVRKKYFARSRSVPLYCVVLSATGFSLGLSRDPRLRRTADIVMIVCQSKRTYELSLF